MRILINSERPKTEILKHTLVLSNTLNLNRCSNNKKQTTTEQNNVLLKAGFTSQNINF